MNNTNTNINMTYIINNWKFKPKVFIVYNIYNFS